MSKQESNNTETKSTAGGKWLPVALSGAGIVMLWVFAERERLTREAKMGRQVHIVKRYGNE